METPNDFRAWIRQVLECRQRQNPRYSLRAFARDVQLSPASVSLVLKGKKGLSRQSAERIARRMGLNDLETARFLELANIESDKRA